MVAFWDREHPRYGKCSYDDVKSSSGDFNFGRSNVTACGSSVGYIGLPGIDGKSTGQRICDAFAYCHSLVFYSPMLCFGTNQ